jgi:hypothetical protein
VYSCHCRRRTHRSLPISATFEESPWQKPPALWGDGKFCLLLSETGIFRDANFASLPEVVALRSVTKSNDRAIRYADSICTLMIKWAVCNDCLLSVRAEMFLLFLAYLFLFFICCLPFLLECQEEPRKEEPRKLRI